MEYRQLGASDLEVSALALGTMTFGEQNSEAEAHAQLDLAVAHGINFIDTAEMYPVPPRAETQGRTERYIGTWLKNRQRDQLIIATKIAGPARGYNWIRSGPRIDRAQIAAALDDSLRRLQPTTSTSTATSSSVNGTNFVTETCGCAIGRSRSCVTASEYRRLTACSKNSDCNMLGSTFFSTILRGALPSRNP